MTFDELDPGSALYWNGSDLSGGFTSAGAFFRNGYDTNWSSWSGFAYSRVNDTNTPGFANQYAVVSGTGLAGRGTYAVGFDNAWDEQDIITLPFPSCVKGFYVNNTTYAALTLRDGDFFCKPFGGATGNDPDWFKLTVTGRDAAGAALGSVDFYLADYRSATNSQDTIVTQWTWVDLRPLGPGVKTLHFALDSTDQGIWGMNTPAFFALDGLVYVPRPAAVEAAFDELDPGPELYWNGSDLSGGFDSAGAFFRNGYDTNWSSWSGFACSRVNDTNTPGFSNQYAVASGTGVGGAGTYAVAFDNPWDEQDVIDLPYPSRVAGFYVNNTTYTALTLRDGDFFCKPFGGATGDDPDWFKLTVIGRDAAGAALGSVDFYLADYRSPTNSQDTIVTQWTWVDLTPLGPGVKTLHFVLDSTDQGIWGMNTPAFFALDGLRWHPSFSDATGGASAWDAGVPGFVGPDGNGQPGGRNALNPAFAGWAASVASYAPAPGVGTLWTNAAHALGPVTANVMDVVSLGDLSRTQLATGAVPGRIVLRFDPPLCDEDGPDFAVFENGLVHAVTGRLFAELAYAEVSSDGTNFARLPPVSLQTAPVGAYDALDARALYNLCGKHANNESRSWGTPFDLADLACSGLVRSNLVDLGAIRFVRLADIPGSGDFTDASVPPNPVYDPWVTTGSGGFDLDAVGAINTPAHARILAQAGPHGRISPCGVPDGLVSVARGGDATFTIEADPGFHLAGLVVDGVEVGRTNRFTFTAVDADHTIGATFGHRLTVRSAHGRPTPPIGEHYGTGLVVCAVAPGVIAAGATQYVCTGWAAAGSAPGGSGTNVPPFVLDADATIAWQWRTNHWLDLRSGYGGRLGAASAWRAAGSTATVAALPDPFFEFGGWRGDVTGDTNDAVATLPMDRPRALEASFRADLATNLTPVGWLRWYGLTNGTPDEAAAADTDGDGVPAWAEYFAGTDPTNADSRLRIVAHGWSNDTCHVAWTGGTNGSTRPFRVLAASSLPGDWRVVADGVQRSASGTNRWEAVLTNRPAYVAVDVSLP